MCGTSSLEEMQPCVQPDPQPVGSGLPQGVGLWVWDRAQPWMGVGPLLELLAAKHRCRPSHGEFDFGQPFPGLAGIDATDPAPIHPTLRSCCSAPSTKALAATGHEDSSATSPVPLPVPHNHRLAQAKGTRQTLEPQVAAKCSAKCQLLGQGVPCKCLFKNCFNEGKRTQHSQTLAGLCYWFLFHLLFTEKNLFGKKRRVLF